MNVSATRATVIDASPKPLQCGATSGNQGTLTTAVTRSPDIWMPSWHLPRGVQNAAATAWYPWIGTLLWVCHPYRPFTAVNCRPYLNSLLYRTQSLCTITIRLRGLLRYPFLVITTLPSICRDRVDAHIISV